jgi:hypothetical protein
LLNVTLIAATCALSIVEVATKVKASGYRKAAGESKAVSVKIRWRTQVLANRDRLRS